MNAKSITDASRVGNDQNNITQRMNDNSEMLCAYVWEYRLNSACVYCAYNNGKKWVLKIINAT